LTLSGTHDQTVNEDEILAWAAYTTGKFKHLSFSGGHFFIKNHQKAILEIINHIGNIYTLT
jgi:surfactin synthase thioesterase subunit